MRKVELLDVESNRYFLSEYTSGSTNDYLLTDGNVVLKLEDCLIYEDIDINEFDEIVRQCKEDTQRMLECGWSIVG